MQSIGSRLDDYKGIGPGFDFLRIFLATAVVGWHAPSVLYGNFAQAQDEVFWVFRYGILTAFFALSGFLISGSALRLSLGNFLINRGLRILPALGVEVLLCALILGPIFTSLALGDYFTSPDMLAYFSNLVGLINFHLPGVFEDHATAVVNRSLWTVPHEVICYAVMSGLIVFGLLKQRYLLATFPIIFLLISYVLASDYLPIGNDNPISRQLNRSFGGEPLRLYIGFLLGIVGYVFRYQLPYSRTLMLLAGAFLIIMMAFPLEDPRLQNVLMGPPIVYLTICLGVTEIRFPHLLTRGDYSYGIYLYGWPIQQIVYYALSDVKNVVLHFLVSMPLILLFAAFSWHVIEKPILGLRKRFSFIAKVRLDQEQDGKRDAAASPAAKPTR